MTDALYLGDLLIGLGLPVFVYLRHRSQPIVRQLFGLGVLIGLSWEVPIFLSAILAAEPVVVFLHPPPLHPLLFLISHAFWDGGIFLLGLAILSWSFGGKALRRFRWAELAVLVLWGQVSELLVELASLSGGLWAYALPHPWNTELFEWRGHPVTLLPQLIWLAAPVAYYTAAVHLARRHAADA